jgi:nicotinamide-nucleotide amidase
MNAHIITIGDEILIGQIIDTNSAWLATELTKIGFTVAQMHSIADDAKAIEEALTLSLEKAELLIFTGGLGPTKDDITKKTLATYFNTPLVFSEEVFGDVVSFIERRGSKMNPLNNDQALVPQKARVLRNANGTAPGLWFEQNGRVVVSLPGVPSEMKALMLDKVLPAVQSFFKLPAVVHRTAIVTEIAESQLAIKLEAWENNLPDGVKLAYLPSPGIVRLRLGVTTQNHDEAEQLLLLELKKMQQIIPENVVSLNEESLQVVIAKLLKDKYKTLSTAESCTGGNIAHLITSIAGSSAYFKGSVVAYANAVKEIVLNVNSLDIQQFGAVSRTVVEQMAQGARNLLQTDYAIATSGIAGPDGGTEEKPVGSVWIAVASSEKVVSKLFVFGNEREINIKRASNAGLNYLRKFLLQQI